MGSRHAEEAKDIVLTASRTQRIDARVDAVRLRLRRCHHKHNSARVGANLDDGVIEGERGSVDL